MMKNNLKRQRNSNLFRKKLIKISKKKKNMKENCNKNLNKNKKKKS